MSLAVSGLLSQDDVGRTDPVGTGHLASFTLITEANPSVDGCLVIRTEPLGVGPGLLGAGEGRIYLEDGAVCHTDGASDAVLVIDVHESSPPHACAAATPVAMAIP